MHLNAILVCISSENQEIENNKDVHLEIFEWHGSSRSMWTAW